MNKRDLTEGSVSGHLLRLGGPMVLGIAAVLSVSLADTYFLGQVGTAELAAISFTFPVVLTVTSIGIGLSAGAASVVSRSIGAGDGGGTERLATDSLILALLLAIPASVTGWFVTTPLFALLGAEGEVLEMVTAYMRIWFVSAPFLIVPMVAMGLIRANGDSTAPSMVMVGAALINVALDPVFIFGLGPVPELGVAGAAYATLAARLAMFVSALAIVIFREKLLTGRLEGPGSFLKSSWRIARIGLPAAGSNMINPISIGAVTALLAAYGNEAVAAFGVATRIETLATIPMLALSSAIGPVAGQNWGNHRPDRTRRSMRDSFLFALLCGVVIGGAFFFFAQEAVSLFSESSVVRNIATSYLVIVGLTLGGYGVVITASAAHNAIGRPLVGLGFTVIRSFVLYVPLAAVAAQFGPTWLVFGGIALANVLSGALVAFMALRVKDGRD